MDSINTTRRGFLKMAGRSAVAAASAGSFPTGTKAAAPLIDGIVHRLSNEKPVRFARGEVAHIVANPHTHLERRMLDRLAKYLQAVQGREPVIVDNLRAVTRHAPAIVLINGKEARALELNPDSEAPESFALATKRLNDHDIVAIAANTDLGLKRGVQRLIIRSRQDGNGLEVPSLDVSETPWIPEREWAVAPWIPEYLVGPMLIANPFADKRMDIWLYSRQQIADYVDMFDSFGFSGVQFQDTCFSWATSGSVDAFHDRVRLFAEGAKTNRQKVSLWLWGASFNQYGWYDPDVTYVPSPGNTAFNDSTVRRTFEKYYDYYTDLAPSVDRVIGHFYDPGKLTNQNDVFNYMHLLEAKFRARNPRIKMAIDMWAANPDYFNKLVDNGFRDYLILEQSHWLEPGLRERIHEQANRLGIQLGLWGWYDTEYETDQLPSMYVNCSVLKELYQQLKNGAAKIHPYSYWSEMEAHHLNDIYSMYVAGQLLWNPDRDPHEILHELTDAIWGPNNCDKVYEALRVIEDTRSGPSWNTYWWTSKEYRLGTKDPQEDHDRADAALTVLQSMKTDESFVAKIPLPFPPATFIEAMIPHLRQIRAFAEFRLQFRSVETGIQDRLSKDELARRITKAWKPIPEYDTWIGIFGQIERRRQESMLRTAAATAGIKLVSPEWLDQENAHRLLLALQTKQSQGTAEWCFKMDDVMSFLWANDAKYKIEDSLQILIAQGWVEKVTEESYRLIDWQNYIT